MNNIAISPNIFMYALQNQNVERKIAKNIGIQKATDTTSTSINDIPTVDENYTSEVNANLVTNSTVETNFASNVSNNDIPDILIPQPQDDRLEMLGTSL